MRAGTETDDGSDDELDDREPHSGPPHNVFLDEKWFYMCSRRRKRKILPKQPNEDKSTDELYPPKRLASRRHATGTDMVVTTRPRPRRPRDRPSER